jgi:chromosome segregation ATPase
MYHQQIERLKQSRSLNQNLPSWVDASKLSSSSSMNETPETLTDINQEGDDDVDLLDRADTEIGSIGPAWPDLRTEYDTLKQELEELQKQNEMLNHEFAETSANAKKEIASLTEEALASKKECAAQRHSIENLQGCYYFLIKAT